MKEARDPAGGLLSLAEQIARERGVAVGSYKQGCLERRIAARMRATGAADFDAYAGMLRANPAEYDELLDALTINVTHLFRDADVWEAVAARVLPELWAMPGPVIHTWVAGCASGEEAYTVAALWHRFLEERGELRRIGRVRITATDLDPDALARAVAGRYDREAFRQTPQDVRTRYFSPSEPHVVVPELRRRITFVRSDLLATAQPVTSVHLLTCRNVLIYFDKRAQDAIFRRFRSALVPGGYLVVGKAEALLGESRRLFDAVDHSVRFFRRPAP
ncbi:MAG: protein-glutamate O-methyltransferase CheR [Gemmatimonadaceae bacterium]|nr:protein-glutamate O-methyltransferase CheR [Gemmatimonadaceae bacterium]